MSRIITAALIVALGIVPSAVVAQQQPQAAQAKIQRPSIVLPFGFATVQPPVLFQWTAVAPGTVNVVKTRDGKRYTEAVSVGAPRYEFQVSDAPDIESNVLVDETITSPSWLFLNQYPDSAFTPRQRSPLGGGTYYYRVRAVFDDYASPYSTITPFVLTGGGGSTTPNHQMSLFTVGVAGTPFAGGASQIYAIAGNVGTYSENSGTVKIIANGTELGTVKLPPLAPGQRATITVPYLPRDAGQAQIVAKLEFNDENPNRKSATITTQVAERKNVTGTIAGTIRRDPDGTFVLDDEENHRLVTLVGDAVSDAQIALLRDQRVFVSGRLETIPTGFRLTVASLVKAAPTATP